MAQLVRRAYGKIIRDTRQEASMTLRGLSKRTGISIAHLSEVERGLKDPSSEVLEDICGGLDLDISDLMVLAAREIVA